MDVIINVFLGILIGFFGYCITAPMEGDASRSCRIPFEDKYLHIHHWMYLIPVLYHAFVYGYNLLIGFCIGGIIQGITMYSDWYKIWY